MLIRVESRPRASTPVPCSLTGRSRFLPNSLAVALVAVVVAVVVVVVVVIGCSGYESISPDRELLDGAEMGQLDSAHLLLARAPPLTQASASGSASASASASAVRSGGFPSAAPEFSSDKPGGGTGRGGRESKLEKRRRRRRRWRQPRSHMRRLPCLPPFCCAPRGRASEWRGESAWLASTNFLWRAHGKGCESLILRSFTRPLASLPACQPKPKALARTDR